MANDRRCPSREECTENVRVSQEPFLHSDGPPSHSLEVSGYYPFQPTVILDFSGMYGKRSVSAQYANNENQIKRGAMPFSGGMYGR